MLSCFMVSGLSALGFAPNAPATGQPVCKLVTPTLSNGNFYPLSFQYIYHPSFPLWINGNAPILFPFIPLQTFSSPSGGYTPSLTQRRPWREGRDSSIPFSLNSLRTLSHNRRPQPLSLQPFADSFHCNRGVHPYLCFPHSPAPPLCVSVPRWPIPRLYFSRCAVRDSQAALRSLHP